MKQAILFLAAGWMIGSLLDMSDLCACAQETPTHQESTESQGRKLQPAIDEKLIAARLPVHQEATQKPNQGELLPGMRTDLCISGIYPHFTTYGIYSQHGGHYKDGHNECGIGAVMPWAGKLWMVNYAPHMPRGSEHKLYSLSADRAKPMVIHPDSVGGTPAGRMIHQESQQLLIAHYLIDSRGNVRVISPERMPIRVTAVARHLRDPANMVYYIDMEGSIWEANVHSLEVRRLFKKPVPGWHGKGGYTSQGRLVVSNNGELHVGDYGDLLVGGKAKTDEERGVLAEWNGQEWKIIERRQYTEVTGPQGIVGGSEGEDPIWAIGWDRRSLRLKLLEDGAWSTYLLPKAAYCNDASHGWYTEWPRIREIGEGRWLMDMHGMFFDFPRSFSKRNSAGLRPVASHLRYIPDFCSWDGNLVLASDETSIQGNPLAGQPQSNLWFGKYENLKEWGPASAYGGPWVEDLVQPGVPSDPFLIDGFDQRCLHLALGRKTPQEATLLRVSDQQKITEISSELTSLPKVSLPRGDWHRPAPAYRFVVNRPVTVFLAVDGRGQPQLSEVWQPTKLSLRWGKGFEDVVYRAEFPAGIVEIPGNSTEHSSGAFGMPHTAFVQPQEPDGLLEIAPLDGSSVSYPNIVQAKEGSEPVEFTLEVDHRGEDHWKTLDRVSVKPDGYVSYQLPADLQAVWLRVKADRACLATAFLQLTTASHRDGELPENQQLFHGIADIEQTAPPLGCLLYPAKRNRNLRILTQDDRYFEFTKSHFEFVPDRPDPDLKKLIRVESHFEVDAASVVVKSGGRQFRLPKGPAAFDEQLRQGWRDLREVESERKLANIHGTFYEIPLLTNGDPPLWNLMRPVSSHRKRITDYCSWNGLLVLAGVYANARNGEHLFVDHQQQVGLWFGGVDDLWKLGKPVGDGGPWFDTKVTRGVASDPYLMTGFDKKTLGISHRSPQTITFQIEVDITGKGLWVPYRELEVPAGKTIVYPFENGFSANWLRVIADADTVATAQLQYR